jgi:hypothetical protein
LKRQIDYALKADVLSNHQDVLALQRRFSLAHYIESQSTHEHGERNPELEALSDEVFFFLSDEDNVAIWREAERINLAYYARVKRLKNRISEMLSQGRCYFLTLTFSDDTLDKTSEQTRRKYVTLFLKTLTDTYVANVDYGSQNGREHYHAVVLADSVNMTGWDRYGFSKAQKIASEADYVPVAKYISKLTNHAVKATTRGCRAIYSN